MAAVVLHFSGAYTPAVGLCPLHFGVQPTGEVYSASIHATLPEILHDLVFSASIPGREIQQIAAVLPAISGSILVQLRYPANIHAAMPAMQGDLRAEYDPNVFRGTVAQVRARSEMVATIGGPITAGWRPPPGCRSHSVGSWRQGADAEATQSLAWRQAAAQRAGVTATHAEADGRAVAKEIGFRGLIPSKIRLRHAYEEASFISVFGLSELSFANLPPLKTDRLVPWGGFTDCSYWLTTFAQQGDPLLMAWRVPWEEAQRWIPLWGGVLPPIIPWTYTPGTALHFRCKRPAPLVLRFSRYPCGGRIVVPVLRVYRMFHEVMLRRVSDQAEIPCGSLEIGIDRDSWSWRISGRLLGAAALEMIREDEPVEIEAEIDGVIWRGVVQEWKRDRQFGQHSATFTALSRAAVLTAPYAAPRTYTETQARTAVQLAEQEAALAGVGIDWSLPDWLIPAGVFTYAQSLPIEQIIRLASAAGGMVQAHRSELSLLCQPAYPDTYWHWGELEPSASIPLAALLAMGEAVRSAPNYEAVWVMGQAQGIACRVLRAQSAGAVLAPTITDPLITHVDAGRGRGIQALNQGGTRTMTTVSMPFQAAGGSWPGLLLPGSLLEITDGTAWRGVISGTKISATRSDKGLTVRQQWDIERFLSE